VHLGPACGTKSGSAAARSGLPSRRISLSRARRAAHSSGPSSITSFQNGTSKSGTSASAISPASSAARQSRIMSPIATPQRGSSVSVENTP